MRQRIAPYLAIDSDSHVGLALDLWDRHLDPEFRDHPDRPRFEHADGIPYFRVDRYSWPTQRGALRYRTPSGYAPGPPGGVDADFRMRDFMDPEGVDRGVLMPGRFMSACSVLANAALGTAQARAWNDWLHAFCSKHPTRLFGYGVINPADTAGAIQEVRRCVRELGFPGIYLPAQVVGTTPAEYKNLADEHYYPIYEEAARLRVPLAIHAFIDPYIEGHEYNWPKGASLLWSDIVGFPMHGMQQLACLILGGVCETFPEVRFGIFEAGLGWVPLFIDRVHERQKKFADAVRTFAPKLKLKPEEYIQRQIWFGFEPEDAFVADFIRWSGAPNRLLFSADYPHLDYERGQIAEFMQRSDVSPPHIRMAMRDNALEYLRWEDTAAPRVTEESTNAAA